MSFDICNVKQVDSDLVVDFAKRTWGEQQAKSVLSEWWFDSDHAETIVALDVVQKRLAGIVVAVKSKWHLPDATLSDTVSICGWYVAPEYAGQGLGRMLVSYFDNVTSSQNTLAISDFAVRAFKKLGWAGPYRTQLLLLPLPALRLRPREKGIFSLRSYDVRGGALPSALSSQLDYIEHNRPFGQIRKSRTADAWSSHLRVWPDRQYRFHIVIADGEPIGAFVLRETDGRAALLYRSARISYVTDIVMNRDDVDSLSFVSASIGPAAAKTSGCLIMCTSNASISKALIASGWLSEESPVIGRFLAAKAPLYMLNGALAQVADSNVSMTFADSDVDLNL